MSRAYSWSMIARILMLMCVAGLLAGCFAAQRQPVYSRSQAQISQDEREAEAAEWLNKAMQLYHDGRFLDPDDALLSLDQAVRLDPTLARAYYHRAVILANRGLTRDALEDADEVVRLRPDLAEGHFLRGSLLVKVDRNLEASQEFGLTTKLDPTFYRAYTQRGLIAAANEEDEAAMDDFTEAIALAPDQYLAYYNRSLVLVRLNRPEEALNDLNQAVTLLPNSLSARVARAEILLKMGEYQRSVGDYVWAARLEPDSHLILSGLARARRGAGDVKGALKDLARAKALAEVAGDGDAVIRYETLIRELAP